MMLEERLHLLDPLFDKAHTDRYKLSVLLKPDGFSYAILDPRTLNFIGLTDIGFNSGTSQAQAFSETTCSAISEHFRSSELLSKPFGSVKIIYASPKVTLVPQGFLAAGNADAYFRFNHYQEPADIIENERVPVGEMHCLFALPSCIEKFRKTYFPETRSGCTAAVLIEGLLKANAHILARQVFVNFWGGHFDIVVIQGRKLLYFNTFMKQAPEDIVYFVLFVLEQLGFVPTEEQITLLGDITTESPDYELLYQYIDRLNFANLFPFADFSPVFSGILVHRYFTLFNLPFCE